MTKMAAIPIYGKNPSKIFLSGTGGTISKKLTICFMVTEWPPIGKIAAHSAYDMFHGISA